MKKYKFWIETGVVGADFYEINEVEDNVTEETLEEYMQNFLHNQISYGYYEVEDEE